MSQKIKKKNNNNNNNKILGVVEWASSLGIEVVGGFVVFDSSETEIYTRYYCME